MGSIPDELLLARIRKEAEARAAAFASLQAALDKATAAFDEKLLVAASKLTTSVGSASALAGTAFRTAVDESSARAEQITALRAQFNTGLTQANASITETRVAFADATQAFAQQTLTLQTQFNASSAKFTEQITAISTDTSALATRTTTLESQVQTPTTGLLARVSTVETTKVDASGAYAQANSAITASLTSTSAGTIGAAVQTEATARANADGFLSGKYSLKVIAGDIVTGMNITSSTGNGIDVSDITFQASSFKVYNGSTGVAPFQVVGGQVKVTGSLVISSGDVTGLGGLATKSSVDLATSEVTNKSLANVDSTANTKLAGIAANADVTLSAINGGLVITSGGLTLDGTPSIKSNNYVAGQSGWAIKGDGTFDFVGGTFRGTIDVGSGFYRTVIDTTGLKVGNLSIDGASNQNTIQIGLASQYKAIVRGGSAASLVRCEFSTQYAQINDAGFSLSNGAVTGKIDRTNNRFNLGTTTNHSVVVVTNDTERFFVGADGHMKTAGGDFRKVTSDGWTPVLFDGSNSISFKWDGTNLKVLIGSTEKTVTTT